MNLLVVVSLGGDVGNRTVISARAFQPFSYYVVPSVRSVIQKIYFVGIRRARSCKDLRYYTFFVEENSSLERQTTQQSALLISKDAI